jgi:hypothetical protein
MIIHSITWLTRPINIQASYKLIPPRELIKRLKAHNQNAIAYIYPDAILVYSRNLEKSLIVTWSDPFFLDEVIKPIFKLEEAKWTATTTIKKFGHFNYNSQLTKILKQL